MRWHVVVFYWTFPVKIQYHFNKWQNNLAYCSIEWRKLFLNCFSRYYCLLVKTILYTVVPNSKYWCTCHIYANKTKTLLDSGYHTTFCYHLRAVTDNLLFFQLLMDHSHDYILLYSYNIYFVISVFTLCTYFMSTDHNVRHSVSNVKLGCTTAGGLWRSNKVTKIIQKIGLTHFK